jgi:hypothetical protein
LSAFGHGSVVQDTHGHAHGGNYILAETHADCAQQQHASTTNTINTEDTGDGADDVHDIGDDGDNEGIRYSRLFEEGGTKVEDKIDAGELSVKAKVSAKPYSALECLSPHLLHRLDTDTSECPDPHLLRSTTEQVPVGRGTLSSFGVKTLSKSCVLVVELLPGKRGDTAERSQGILVSTLDTEVTWRLWKPEHTANKNRSPEKLQGHDSPPAAVVGAGRHEIVDNGGEEDADGDAPLV